MQLQAYENSTTPQDMVRWEGVLWMEDTVSTDGRVVEQGAIEWQLPAPLTEGDAGGELVGVIRDVRRGEAGQMVASGHVRADHLPEGEERGVAMSAVVFFAFNDGHATVMDGRLVGAALGATPVWPQCRIRRAG